PALEPGTRQAGRACRAGGAARHNQRPHRPVAHVAGGSRVHATSAQIGDVFVARLVTRAASRFSGGLDVRKRQASVNNNKNSSRTVTCTCVSRAKALDSPAKTQNKTRRI